MAKETRSKSGTLPEAADMLQMVWDDELAAIAQKWADNCEFQHDCPECRMVESFRVGQNIARDTSSCPSKECSKQEKKKLYKPDWKNVIRRHYDEVKDFKKDWIMSYDGKFTGVGHFTQVVWSRSWRVGCGYTVYKVADKYNKFYVCNYGPGGNVQVDYPGLCKMKDPKKAPTYPRKTDDLLFFCDAVPETKACALQVNSTRKLENKVTLSGNYYTIKLRKGQVANITFKKEFSPKGDFCVRIIYRKTASKAEVPDQSDAEIEIFNGNGVIQKKLKTTKLEFLPYQISLNWKTKTKVSIIFSVKSSKRSHIFDLKEVLAHDGKCGTKDI
ncbi:CRISP/Allergen/PR-1 like protein [Argiope bruennichi]|uniref:CRISP/Allergen/PR-1 like protein n=1 Tax=Argiope bruennichi TaxID=94029 RepID=A0A8T0E368_ARGBR|nr:CRISP/Allergen/PR-1 like protein [Argiope bruennichi]